MVLVLKQNYRLEDLMFDQAVKLEKEGRTQEAGSKLRDALRADTRSNSDLRALWLSMIRVCILLQQQFKGLSKTARLQANHIALFPVLNDEWTSILESLAGRNGISREKLEQAYRIATAKPFGFLWLDMNAGPSDVFWSSFTKKIVPT